MSISESFKKNSYVDDFHSHINEHTLNLSCSHDVKMKTQTTLNILQRRIKCIGCKTYNTKTQRQVRRVDGKNLALVNKKKKRLERKQKDVEDQDGYDGIIIYNIYILMKDDLDEELKF